MASAVTSRYAKALIELADDSKLLKKVEKDLLELSAMLSNSSDLMAVISTPSLSLQKQKDAMFAVADKADFQDITKNFLGVLVHNRRIGALPSMIEAVNAQLAELRGEITAQVQTAQKMTEAQAKALQEALSKSAGRSVSVNATVEPSILGGMIVTIGSQMIDNSVARKLERLQGAMSGQANQNINTQDKTTTTSKTKTKKG